MNKSDWLAVIMQILFCVGCMIILVETALLWYPGGALNPHDWISEHAGRGQIFDPLAINFSASESWKKQHPDARPGCWAVDFCTRHSEVRVTPCKQEKPEVKP